MKKIFLILSLASCSQTKTVSLNGYKSYALNGKHIIAYRWVTLKGDARISHPDSVQTRVSIKENAIIQLMGVDNAGEIGYDTITIKK